MVVVAALLLLLALGALSLLGPSEGRGAGLARLRSHFHRSTFDSCVPPPSPQSLYHAVLP